MKNPKKKLFIWASDYSLKTGEGKLARLFVEKILRKNKYKLVFNQKKILNSRYLSSISGIIYCWKKYFKNQKVCYLNYLPLWNIIIFIFLPPQTILGPITGGSKYDKSNFKDYLLRGILFRNFYAISEFFLNLRNNQILFSTSLLKPFLGKKIINKSQFNFIFKSFILKKKVKKSIDFIIYYRKHNNKLKFFPLNFIKNLIKNKFKVYVVGDTLDLPSIKNLGYISYNKVSYLQSISKYTISSNENIYSFFTLECISNNIKIIIDKKKNFKSIKKFKKSFVKINLNSSKEIQKLKRLN